MATSSNRIGFTSNGGSATTFSASSALTLNKWNFAAVTRDASGVANIYINGVLSGTANQTSGTPASGSSVIIGNNSATTRTFDGLIDELRIYDHVLSASDILQLYNSGKIVVKTGRLLVSP